jgi:hypothetical protein
MRALRFEKPFPRGFSAGTEIRRLHKPAAGAFDRQTLYSSFLMASSAGIFTALLAG